MKWNDWVYLGDGVYAHYDGHGLTLHANSHSAPTDRIYLEPDVMAGLMIFYAQRLNEKESEKNGRAKQDDGHSTPTVRV